MPERALKSDNLGKLCYTQMVPLRAVLFDLDGTLVDTERENVESMARALHKGLGIVATQEERDFVVGHSLVEIYNLLRRGHPELSWSMDQLIAEAAREREAIFEESGIATMPGAHAAVERFAHVPRAIVTGSSRAEARASLFALGFSDTFDAVYAAEDVATSKPSPDGYLQAASTLQVAVEDCLVIEDSVAGIGAGVAAGARVVAVRAGNYMKHDQSAAHRIVDTLEDITLEFANRLWT